MSIFKLIDFFFITFSINLFVSIYTIYNFFEFKILFNEQGSKLKIKKEYLNQIEKGGRNNKIYK